MVAYCFELYLCGGVPLERKACRVVSFLQLEVSGVAGVGERCRVVGVRMWDGARVKGENCGKPESTV